MFYRKAPHTAVCVGATLCGRPAGGGTALAVCRCGGGRPAGWQAGQRATTQGRPYDGPSRVLDVESEWGARLFVLTSFRREVGGVGDGDDVAGEHRTAGRLAVVGDTLTFPATNPNGDLIQLAPPAAPPVGFPAIQSTAGNRWAILILLTNNIRLHRRRSRRHRAFGHEDQYQFRELRPLENEPIGGREGKHTVYEGRGRDGGQPDLGGHFSSKCLRPPQVSRRG